MRSEWKKDGGKRSRICKNSVTESEQIFYSKGEKITDGTEMRGKYAAEHSK